MVFEDGSGDHELCHVAILRTLVPDVGVEVFELVSVLCRLERRDVV